MATRLGSAEEGMAMVEAVRAGGRDALFLFFGTEDGGGESWCADCRIYCPVARAACIKAACAPLYEVPVGTRGEWKAKEEEEEGSRGEHASPVRKDKDLGVTRIPTLVRFVCGKVVGRLVEDQLSDKAAIATLLH
jgi:hypothetical protein